MTTGSALRRWTCAALAAIGVLGIGCNRTGAFPSSDPESRSEPVRSLILVVIDTLRADHVGVIGYGRETTPRLDELATRGAVFTQAIAQSSWTRASMGSVLTGLYPTTLGLTCANFRVPRGACDLLPDDAVTLAEVLSGAGLQTAAVVANINVDPLFGFDQGFDEYHLALAEAATARPDWRQTNDWLAETTALVTARAVEWLEGRSADDRFFLYLHYLDPHDPYDPPADLEGLFDPTGYTLGEAYRADAARYDAEIRHVDQQLGLVFDALAASGLDATTGIVVTSDHGEEFGEHGGTQHGWTMYEEQLRVPLIMVLPGITRPGTRLVGQVQLLDVMPTVLDALAVSHPDGLQGRSVVPALASTEATVVLTERPAYSERGYSALVSWRRPPWKLILDTDSGQARLYHLPDDPGETADIAASEPDVVERLTAEVTAARERAQADGRRIRRDQGVVELSPEQIEQLRQLGYVDEGG